MAEDMGASVWVYFSRDRKAIARLRFFVWVDTSVPVNSWPLARFEMQTTSAMRWLTILFFPLHSTTGSSHLSLHTSARYIYNELRVFAASYKCQVVY